MSSAPTPSATRASLLAVLPLIAFELAIASFAIVRVRDTDAAPPVIAAVGSAQATPDVRHGVVDVPDSARGVNKMVVIEGLPYPD